MAGVSRNAHKTIQLFYGYVIVAAACCIMAIAWGTNRTFGIFIDPLLREFGWSRAGLSGVYTTCMLVSGTASLLLGHLTDRIGPRVLLIVCSFAMGGGYFFCSLIHELWQFYLAFGILTGIGMSGSWAPLMSVVARWFHKRRSLMSGILAACSALGVVLMPIFATYMIDRLGWRSTFVFLGILTFLTLFTAAIFLKRDPIQIGATPFGYSNDSVRFENIQIVGMSLSEAVRTHTFWLMTLVCFCDFFLINVVAIHIVPHALTLRIDPIHAAAILSLSAAISILGRIGMGILSERFSNRMGMFICLSLSVMAFLLLPFATELIMFYGFSVFFGFGLYAASAIVSPLIADLFGLKSHGAIYSCTFFGSTMGGALGPILVGYLYDLKGNYQSGFLLCLIISVTALVSRQPCNVGKSVVYFLHNQPGRIGYEEISRYTDRRRTRSSWRTHFQGQAQITKNPRRADSAWVR